MTRPHFIKKARKDNPAVKKGESYWWWKFRYQRKRYSKFKPTRGQLTQSAFLSEWYDLVDTMTPDADSIREAMEMIENLIDTCYGSLGNMPENLQDSSPAAEMLNERIDQLQEWVDEAEGAELDESSTEALQELIDMMPEF